VYRVLSDPAALLQNRKRREGILIFLLSLSVLLIAGGALWYILLQAGKLPNLVSAPVSSPAEVQKAPTAKRPAPPTQPAPTVAPTQQQATPQPGPSPTPQQQAAPLPPSASPAAPAGQPATQAA